MTNIEGKIYSHKDLIVWQKGMQLASTIYTFTSKFPKEEMFGISSQMRRAAVSIPSNIAEGRNRGTKKDYLQFLRIAAGSCAELETQLELSKNFRYISGPDFNNTQKILIEVSKMLRSIIYKFQHSES